MEFNFLENNDPNKPSGKQPEKFSFSFDQNSSDQNQAGASNEGSDDSLNFLNNDFSSAPDPNESISDNYADEGLQENAPVFEEAGSDDEILMFADEDNAEMSPSESADPYDFLSDSAAAPADEAPAEPASNGGFDFNFAQEAAPADEVPAEPASNGGFDFNFAQEAAPADEVPAEPASNGGFDFNFAQEAAPADEVPAEPASNGGFDFNFAQEAAPADEAPAEPASEYISDDVVEDVEFAPAEESDSFVPAEPAQELADDNVGFGLASAEAGPTNDNYLFGSSSEPTSPASSTDVGFNKRVRTPDTGVEYNLSDLIDVETGLPLDLSSFQQASYVDPNADAGVYSLASAPVAGGFSMTPEGAGDSETDTAPTRRRRTPKPVKKSKNALVELIKIVLGAVAGIVIAMYLAVLIAPMIGKGESNIPVPLPGLPQTYKHIPKDFPESMMWLFPGRAADSPVTVDDNQSEDISRDKEDLDKPQDDSESKSSDDLEDDPAFNTDFLNEGKAKESDAAEETAEPAAAEEAANSGLGYDNPPTFSDNQLKAKVDKVGKAYAAAGKKFDPSVCMALGDMALAATFAESNAGSMGKVQKIMELMVGKLPGASETLGKSLNERLNDMEDEGGFVAVGTISEKVVRSGYKLAIIQVEGIEGSKDNSADGLEDKGANGLVVEFVGTKEISPKEGDRVIFSGKILTNPAAQLKDFEPGREPSLWGGIILVNSAKPAPAKKAPKTEAVPKVEAAPMTAAPATEEAAPATEEAAPATEEAAPATEEAAPATEEAAPATEEAAPATEEAAPATEEAAPATEEAAPTTEEAAPATEEAAEKQ